MVVYVGRSSQKEYLGSPITKDKIINNYEYYKSIFLFYFKS
jgi:hypothetical protein